MALTVEQTDENIERVDRAANILALYAKEVGEDESNLCDLLADLMHWSARDDSAADDDFNRALASARMHFEAETDTTHKPLRIVIGVEGGVVQGASADGPCDDIDIMVADYDTEGADDDMMCTVDPIVCGKTGGRERTTFFACGPGTPDADPEFVEKMYAAAEAHNEAKQS